MFKLNKSHLQIFIASQMAGLMVTGIFAWFVRGAHPAVYVGLYVVIALGAIPGAYQQLAAQKIAHSDKL